MLHRAVCLLVLTWLCLLPKSSAVAQGAWNRIINPGFERGIHGWNALWGKSGTRVADLQGAHASSRCLVLATENANLAVDGGPIYVDWDFDCNQRHLVSAYVSKVNVKRGDLGVRFYCYDAEGKHLAMCSAGNFGPGASVADWREIRVEVGPGTRFEFPPATDHVVVRFSFWSKEGDCSGTCLIDDVFFGPVQDVTVKTRKLERTSKGAVALWSDRISAGSGVSDPTHLAALLKQAGFGVNLLDTRELTDRGVLNTETADLLILPYGGCHPADMRALRAYLRHGGRLITLGGPCFTRPLYPVAGAWTELTRKVDVPPQAIVELSEAKVATLAAQAKRGADPAEVSLSTTPDGHPALHVVVPELRGYRYLDFSGRSRADQTLLHLRARGDDQTKYLCLELTETDGSRWKAIVELTPAWQTYDLSLAQFAAYASKNRGGRGDYPRPEQIVNVRLGFSAKLVGKGHREFELAELQWHTSTVPPALSPSQMQPLPNEQVLMRTFGELHLPPRPLQVTTFFGSQVYADVDGVRLASGQSIFGPAFALPGRVSGQTATILTDDLALFERSWRQRHRQLIPTQQLAYAVPLLVLPDGRPVASLFHHFTGDCAGSLWACFGVTSHDLFPAGNQASSDAFVRLVEHMLGSASLVGVKPRFEVHDGRARMRVFVKVVNHATAAKALDLHAQVIDSEGNRVRAEKKTPVRCDAGETQELLALETYADTFDWKKFRVECRLLAPDQEQTWITTSVDVRATLLLACDRMLETQCSRGDGKFSGRGYIDNRGARALLAAYDLTGRNDYREAALAWGRSQIAEQREDGGYLMGYGYYPVGNECYVADGGEIACAIARLTTYAPKVEKDRFFQSLKAYMGYRESFRCEGGGLGVGWCKTDFGTRPVKPLDKITKIYAPEKNIYTIGCTLAAAVMYAQLTANPADNDAAVRDAQWLMPRCQKTTTGAFVESFVWAHKFLKGKTIQQDTAQFLREKVLPGLLGNDRPWWTDGGGRSAQAIDGLAYYYDYIDKDPQVLAALINATYQICSPESLAGIPRLLARENLTHNQWHYLNFTAVSLPNLLQPEIVRQAF